MTNHYNLGFHEQVNIWLTKLCCKQKRKDSKHQAKNLQFVPSLLIIERCICIFHKVFSC